ncbi:MAG: ribbon-helix-helix protein, CopG family [Streptosporangiales bacterium]
MRRVQIHLDEWLDEAAAREAARRGVSKAALIRDSLAATVRLDEPVEEEDPWEAMIGWLDDDPVDDIDAVIYGPAR